MNNVWNLALLGASSFVIGLVFFGGLWWTVKRSIESSKAALWLFCSLLIRMSFAIICFYIMFTGDFYHPTWLVLFICMAAFVLARIAVLKTTEIFAAQYLIQPKTSTSTLHVKADKTN